MLSQKTSEKKESINNFKLELVDGLPQGILESICSSIYVIRKLLQQRSNISYVNLSNLTQPSVDVL